MNTIPDTSPSPWPLSRVGIKSTIWGFLCAGAVRGCYYLFTQQGVNGLPALLLILVTFGLGLVCISYICHWVTGLDEMQQRIQLLSLAWVGPGILLTAIFAEMLRWADLLDPITWNVRVIGIVFLAVYCIAFGWLWLKNR